MAKNEVVISFKLATSGYKSHEIYRLNNGDIFINMHVPMAGHYCY